MNGYKLSRKIFDWAWENQEKINPAHIAIYMLAVDECNRSGWLKNFNFSTSEAMKRTGIKNRKTYNKRFKQLCEWGFLTLIKKSKNQYFGNTISLSGPLPKTGKHFDRVLISQSKGYPSEVTANGNKYSSEVTAPSKKYPSEVTALLDVYIDSEEDNPLSSGSRNLKPIQTSNLKHDNSEKGDHSSLPDGGEPTPQPWSQEALDFQRDRYDLSISDEDLQKKYPNRRI